MCTCLSITSLCFSTVECDVHFVLNTFCLYCRWSFELLLPEN